MRWRTCVLSALLLCGAARADVLTFAISPTSDPAKSLACRIEVTDRHVIVVEVAGTGMPPDHALRWPMRRPEQAAMLAALQALIVGDLTSVDTYSFLLPPAPTVTVTWSTTVNGRPVAGLYAQSGLSLPPVLAQVIDATMPGSRCQTATNSGQ